MAPKVKITKDDIIDAAMGLVRTEGERAIGARALASALNCSTQPIFSNFESMEELKLAVVKKADELCGEYIQREIEGGLYPAYKASGMAYIRFAKEEKELFKLLYMRDRTGEDPSLDSPITAKMEDFVQSNTGLCSADAKLFHLEIWACVHGIAAMFATSFIDLEWELVSKMITDTYMGLKKQYGVE